MNRLNGRGHDANREKAVFKKVVDVNWLQYMNMSFVENQIPTLSEAKGHQRCLVRFMKRVVCPDDTVASIRKLKIAFIGYLYLRNIENEVISNKTQMSQMLEVLMML